MSIPGTIHPRTVALALGLVLGSVSALQAAEQPGARFREGTHYVLTGDQLKRPEGVVVRVYTNLASAAGADLLRRLPAWIQSLPEGVRVVTDAPPVDQTSDALSRLFYALEHLERPDLHAQVYQWAFEQRRPLVAVAAGRVDDAQTTVLQSRFVQSFGISDEVFRAALATDDVNLKQVSASLVFVDVEPLAQALPAIVVNGKYLTDAQRAGPDLFAIVEQLIAMADIDNALALGEQSGRLPALARDPVQAAWHTRVPGIFELQRAGGTWYLDRTGQWGGPAALTHLGSVVNVSASGAVRVGVNDALPAMRAKPRWVDASRLARDLGIDARRLLRVNEVGVWEVRRDNGPYYLSADALFHFYSGTTPTTGSEVNPSAREVAATLRRNLEVDTAPARPATPAPAQPAAAAPGRVTPAPTRAAPQAPLREGLRSVRGSAPSTADEIAARRPLLAQIRDEDVVTFAPVRTPTLTLTAFVFDDCAPCKILYSHRDRFVALGVKIRFVPVAPRAVVEGVACASDRRAAMTAVMTNGTVPARCSSAGAPNYTRLATDLNVEGTPTIFSATGTVVVGYTTPEELIRVLSEAR